jgi:hypothetical protein
VLFWTLRRGTLSVRPETPTADISRDASILKEKVATCALLVHAVTSLDDAIDFANRLVYALGIDQTPAADSLASFGQLLASYYYTTAPAGKYLAQFIASDVSFVNHVPASLLRGSESWNSGSTANS